MSGQLGQRAAGLAADAKQKISLGRGLVREDVSAVLFDEPLTVIDPHLKWQLRRKLKQIHHELKLTLIYVTHDQVEALTFAEQVVVMTRGQAVQIGTRLRAVRASQPHLRRLLHRFARHELPAARGNGQGIEVAGRRFAAPNAALPTCADFTLGVRPEHVQVVASDERRRRARRGHAGAGHRHLLAASRRAWAAAATNRCCARGWVPSRRFRASATSAWLPSSARTPALPERGADRMTRAEGRP